MTAASDIEDFIEVCRLLGWTARVMEQQYQTLSGAIILDIRTKTRGVAFPVSKDALHDRGTWIYFLNQTAEKLRSA